MSKPGKHSAIRESLTERQQYWLAHLEKADAGGESLRDYAAREKVSIHSLYSARKRLAKLGMSFSQPARRSSPVVFDRVKVAPPPSATVVVWRLRFPNGVVLESNTALTAEIGTSLMSAMTHLR